MTRDEFFQQLADSDHTFVIDNFENIRTPDGQCPICALARHPSKTAFIEAGRQLGLSYHDRGSIANAADMIIHPIRARMLAACRLQEREYRWGKESK